MDTRLLKHYESELSFMREMGAEFAESYPKIAARLGMESTEVLDPYVERLLEGFAFLSARVQLELELQYPAFTSHLLEIIYPHFLAPTPSMMVAAFTPDPAQSTLEEGWRMARGTALRSGIAEGMRTPCVFRTATDLTLWPLQVKEAAYVDGRADLLAAGVGHGLDARAAIRLRLARIGGGQIGKLPLEHLSIFLTGDGSWRLHELLCTQVEGLAGRSTDRRADWKVELPDASVTPKGFNQDEALLPTPPRSFDGYRLLQEYFAMPQRFHFVELRGIGPALRRADGADVDIFVMLREGMPEIAPHVSPEAFVLHAVPAINLFHKRCDRVQVSQSDVEQHVVPDRTAPMDVEVHSLESVIGIRGGNQNEVEFRPFYSQDDFTPAGESHAAYYMPRRRLRERSERERLKGTRTSYLGSEMYVSLVDRSEAPWPGEVQQLAVSALCTNRDLPILLTTGEPDVFHLPDGGPVSSVRTPVPPTRPHATLAESAAAWRLISHLSLNYLSIADTRMGGGAAALRELVGIYAPLGDRTIEKQLEGILSVSSRPIVRRMSDEVLSTAVRGVEITVDFDESFFDGTSVYLLGAVLDRFFRKYVTINSFAETVLRTRQRGVISRSRPEGGQGRLI